MRFLLFLYFFICFFLTQAQNNLRLYSFNGNVFKAYLNGNVLSENLQASILIENLEDDTVKIKVEFENKLMGEQTVFFLEKGEPIKHTEFNYSIEIKNNKVKFNFTGTQPIIKLPDPLVPTKPIIDTSAKYRNNLLGHYCELKEGKAIYFNNKPKTGDCKTPMPAEYINYLNILMSKAQIEEDKISIAENTTRNNCINVAQLNKILFHITYEIEKIKLIKLSFYTLIDKNNVKNLDSTFKLESSKRELASFIKNADEYKVKTGVNCIVAASEGELNQLYTDLSIYSNDTERLQYLKKKYMDYCYSANQVKLLLGVFIHDREKLEAAELLFVYSTEKENYLIISDVFSYNTTAAELKEFVAKQKN